MDRRHFDVIAEHVVVPDLERRDTSLTGIAPLQFRDQLARIVAQAAQLIQFARIFFRDEAAIARIERQVLRQGARQHIDQRVMRAELA